MDEKQLERMVRKAVREVLGQEGTVEELRSYLEAETKQFINHHLTYEDMGSEIDETLQQLTDMGYLVDAKVTIILHHNR